MVLFSRATLPIMAAAAIHVPSQRPPIMRAASEKNPVCHCCQFPAEASPANAGRKYAAIDNGTTTASARGYAFCGFSTSSATVESCS